MDGAQRSETAGIFATALEIADFLTPLTSAAPIDAKTAGSAGMGVAKVLGELKQRLEQVPSFVDVPTDVLAALKSIAKTVRYAHTDCPAYGDMALHLGRSDLRVAATNGWQALQRSDPKNDEVLAWAAEDDPAEDAAIKHGDLSTISEGQPLTLLDRYPDTPGGHIGFVEWVNVELREQAEALRQNKYPHESIERQLTGGGVKWREAKLRIARLSGLDRDVIERVAKVLRRDLNIGTVEQVVDLLGPAMRDLRNAWEDTKAADNEPTENRPDVSLVDLIGRVIRRLKAKPDLLRGYVWDDPETLNVKEINSAAKALALGPIFAIAQAPDWAHAPNLSLDHPVNQRKVESLRIYHPDGSAFQIRRSGDQLDDNTSLPAAETLVRLEAWSIAAARMLQVADVETNRVEVATPGDLWKALTEGKEPAVTVSSISIGPPFGPNIPHQTFPKACDQIRWNVLEKALALCDAEGGDRGEAMRKLIARVALAKDVDRRQIINLPLADFVKAAVGDATETPIRAMKAGEAQLGAIENDPATKVGSEKREPAEPGGDSSPPVKSKRSTERGEGQKKLIAALTKHHEYADGGCLKLEPIGNNELARLAGVSESTASAFFNKQFDGHTKYRAMCADTTRLVTALKLINQEFVPHHLFGAKPPDEGDHEDDE